MDNTAPCFTDSKSSDDQLTEAEKRLGWLCDAWQDALEIDSHEEWHDVRLSIYGATQALNMCSDRRDDLAALRELGNTAFQHCLDRIAEGKYEGATK